MGKNKISLIFKHFIILLYFSELIFISLFVFISIKFFSIKANFLITKDKIKEIIVEYIIFGIWYIKSKTQLSKYILCIVESWKNNELTAFNKAKENINKIYYIYIGL